MTRAGITGRMNQYMKADRWTDRGTFSRLSLFRGKQMHSFPIGEGVQNVERETAFLLH
jgi:hypothetical protein